MGKVMERREAKTEMVDTEKDIPMERCVTGKTSAE